MEAPRNGLLVTPLNVMLKILQNEAQPSKITQKLLVNGNWELLQNSMKATQGYHGCS